MMFLDSINAVNVTLLLAGVVIVALTIRAIWMQYRAADTQEEALNNAEEDADAGDNSVSTLLRLPISIWSIALVAFLTIHFTPWGALHITEGNTITLYAEKALTSSSLVLLVVILLSSM